MRTSTARPPRGGGTVNPYTIGALLAQIGSFATTYAFFAVVLTGMSGLTIVLIAAGVEFLLTLGKSLLFNASNKDDMIGWSAIIFDTLLNAGGLWPYTTRLADTPTAAMLAGALGLEQRMGPVAALVLALVFGYLLAVAPHRLWHARYHRAEAD